MSIEENIGRAAAALERIAEAIEKNSGTLVNIEAAIEWNRARLEKKYSQEEEQREKPDAAQGRTPAEPEAAAAAEEGQGQWTYEALKAELQKRGVVVAKGTKMTTLVKWWGLHKDDPIGAASAAESAVTSSPAAPAAASVPETPAEEKAPVLITRAEAIDRVSAALSGKTPSREEVAAVRGAFAAFDAKEFNDIPDSRLGEFVEVALAALAALKDGAAK